MAQLAGTCSVLAELANNPNYHELERRLVAYQELIASFEPGEHLPAVNAGSLHDIAVQLQALTQAILQVL